MSWQIISAIALIILAIVAIIKKVETRMTLLLAGFAMCVLAGHPMAAFQSFIKGMVNINLVPPICAAMGFAAAVTFLSATNIWLYFLLLRSKRSAAG